MDCAWGSRGSLNHHRKFDVITSTFGWIPCEAYFEIIVLAICFKRNRPDDLFRFLGRYISSLKLPWRSKYFVLFVSPVSVNETQLPCIVSFFLFPMDFLYHSDRADFCCGRCSSSGEPWVQAVCCYKQEGFSIHSGIDASLFEGQELKCSYSYHKLLLLVLVLLDSFLMERVLKPVF